MGDFFLSNFDLANSILIDRTLLEISKLSMLGILSLAVFSYCTFKLTITKSDKSIIIFCILNWFRDYSQRSTQWSSVVTHCFACCWINNKAMKYWDLLYSCFIYLLFFQRRWTWSQIKRYVEQHFSKSVSDDELTKRRCR